MYLQDYVCIRDFEDTLKASEQEDDRKIKMKAREALDKASAEGKVCTVSVMAVMLQLSCKVFCLLI